MSRREFVYCPYCATPLTERRVGEQVRRACPACGYIRFPDPKVAVIAQIERNREVLLVRRGVNPAKGLWALPGGYMDAGELPVAALVRELQEEIALEVVVHELLAIYPMVNQMTSGETASQGIVLAYRVTPVDPAAPPGAYDDVTEARWFGPEELPDELAFASTREQLRHWQQRLGSPSSGAKRMAEQTNNAPASTAGAGKAVVPKTYLVTGGAGFLGINLVRYLLGRGHKIVSLDISDFTYPERARITEIKGDIRDKAAVDNAMQGVDIVIHTAAALPLYKAADIYSTDIDGLRAVLQSAYEHKVERCIHVSSTAVYGIPDHHPLFEDDQLHGVGPYGEAKVVAEEMCKEYRAKGMCIPIIRPKSFVGPERLGVFALFYDWAKDGKNFPVLGSGNNRYQLLDVEDLCDAIYLAATLEPGRVDDVFNIGAKVFTTIREDYQAVLDYAGFGKKIVSIPASPAIWTLRALEKVNLSPLYKWVYETVTEDSFVSIEKAEKVLGYAPKYSNKQALIRNYQWYIDHLSEFQGQSGVSHRVPWKQGALGIAKLFF